MVFADDLPAHAEFLDQSVAFESVRVQRPAKLGFFHRKFADDAVNLRGCEGISAAGKFFAGSVCGGLALLCKACCARARQNQRHQRERPKRGNW